MFVSHIAPRMDRYIGANHPTARRPGAARAKLARAARRFDNWTLEVFNPVEGRHFR